MGKHRPPSNGGCFALVLVLVALLAAAAVVASVLGVPTTP